MRGEVFNNNLLAGYLFKDAAGQFVYRYADDYFSNKNLPAISLTLPKAQQEYHAPTLFPFFFGLLAEGVNKDIQCRLLKIDERDDFTRLLQTANNDTIGSITVKQLE